MHEHGYFYIKLINLNVNYDSMYLWICSQGVFINVNVGISIVFIIIYNKFVECVNVLYERAYTYNHYYYFHSYKYI